ncbi:hypothetical protein VTL71DRAFT_2921 [Oculimacula yallundae]|uniref:SWI-SNF chromatin-remodeling complex protein n=1 Tax=Oculimacula yallundae TaxID=86028 RepID=A0ABR4C6W3_9HELO
MSRPFPNTFDKDSPMSPQSAVSYQTNVNRQKTKKWTEAKAVDYGGDDWGDDDDYDPPPPPITKSTGLRQQGPGLAGSSRADSPVVDNGRKYGDLPPLPGATNSRPRANSFDADDEQRNFSNSSNQPPLTSNAPATRFSQITGAVTPRNESGPPALSISTQQPAQAPVALQQTSQFSPVPESPHPNIMMPAPGRTDTGESSIASPVSEIKTPSTAGDFQARRDFSPSAVPQPLSTRASPAPQSATDTTPNQRFPARKSSLSQVSGPPLDEIMRAESQDTTPKPWIGARPASPGTGAKSPVSPSKALPFIRPADIYRRAEEERRQSIESSGRPSMDSLVGPKSTEHSDSSSKSYARGGPESSAGRRRASLENEDGSDSGRRLMPMLEPVKERKSEYGFEGFNVNDHGPQQPAQAESRQSQNLDVESIRRQSTSPKLPDLTRMSGFGVDMFSSDDVETIKRESENTPTTATLSSPDQDLKLRNQPSFGFKSVVNQAFDTTDDHSLPDTPASRSASGVNRTDSESTGTGGISPIMSRVSSTAIPETRNRDISTPAIMEAKEPDSPERSGNYGSHGKAFDTPQAPGFKPGHRRDISAPSPGNSPARTPDLATSHHLPGSQHAVVDESSSDVTTPTIEEPLQAPRPFAEREHSFRPSLPGGWTSYATTAQSDTPTLPAAATPVSEAAPSHEDNDKYDLTPTTTKPSLPQSVLGASLAGATLGSAALGGTDHNSPSQTPVAEAPSTASTRSPLTSSDSIMLPSGHQHPSQPLETTYPPLEHAPAETQLRPDAVNRPVSSQSTPPPPLPKDTPPDGQIVETSDYFPTIPVAKTPDGHISKESSNSPVRPRVMPTLSAESADDDEENDKLRKEIVKSLTPTASNATTHTSSTLSDAMDASSLQNPNRESSYLPSEYDNYWATTDQDEEVPAIPGVHRDVSDVRPSTASTAHTGLESPIPAPLSPHRPGESLQPPRPSLQSRFSWEQSTDDVTAGVNRDQGYLATDTAARSPLANELPGSVPVEEEKEVAPQSQEPETTGHTTDHHGARDAALLAGGAALVGGAAAVTYSDRPEEKSRRLSLAEEKDPHVTSHPVSPTPPEDEHPSRSPQHNFPTSPETYQHPPAPPSTVSPVASSVHPFAPPPPPAGRLIAFREIVAMKSPQERIKTFDETRHRFATMDSGLNDWIAKLQGQYPDEHGGVTGSWGNSRASMPGGSMRGKFPKSPAGGPAQPLQQPYYQQYLNASSPTSPSTPIGGASRPSPSMPTGSQQGLSSAGSKMTTQQVQAKGKELLHTAGIFGGKAGKAGKGLLAKGKNKLRAAGGGDKTSPPAKTKPDRRSSWGLPLSLSRSSTRPDAMSRSSREGTPNSTFGRPRTNTMPSERTSPAPQIPAVATGDSLGVMSGALTSEHPEASRQTSTTEPSSLPAPNQTAPPVQDLETRDSLGVPAPIGKNQPSWDPFNATPIAEEDDFQYEGRPKPRLSSSDPNSNPDGLSVPADNLAKSDRSNSTDAPFFDAREESEDLNNDWVMVSPQLKAQESAATTSVSKPESNNVPTIRQSLEKPTTSILNRPRGSFSNSNETLPQLLSQMKSDADATKSVDGGPTTSILNRPRGSFSYDTPPISPAKPMTSPLASPPLINPTQPSQHIQRAATPPAPVVAAASVPKQRTPSPQKAAQPEKQSGASSFLPPIRRTSTFGIGFGSRHPKQRFPIEDDGEISPPRMPSGPQQQHVDELSNSTSQSGPGPESDHSGTIVGAAVGTAAAAGLLHHENKAQTQEEPTRRDSFKADNQRPLSFVQISAPRTSSQRPPSFPFEQEDLGPADDTNTWGVRDELPRIGGQPPMPISAGRQRQPSFPPPGFITDPAPLPTSSGKQRQPSFPPPGFVTDPAPFKDTVRPHQSLPEPAFAEEPEEIDPRDDTNTWGVRDELPPNLVHPPMPGASGKQKQDSFPPAGYTIDPFSSQGHGPTETFQPVDSRSTSLKKLLTDETPSSVKNEQQSFIPPQVLQVDTQTREPTKAIREVSPAPPAQARNSSREPLPRPLSFQRTPPRESGPQRKPSLPLSFTREPEEIGPRAGNDADEGSTLGADTQRSMSIAQRDPEKDDFNAPQEPAQQVPQQPPQRSPQRDSKAMFPPRADAVLQNPELNKSQVEWRPNRPKVVTKPAQPSYSSESYSKEVGISAARTNSWDAQPPPRAYSGSSSYSQRHESQFSEKGGWGSPQPPSSAQRYPELFKPGQQQSVGDPSREADLPAHYYQAPISRAQAFLPRQQGNEYQIPGVGPPQESPANPTRRNSGFLRDIGGRLSRTSSRERRTSISRDQERLSPDRGLESRGEYAESSVMSEDGLEQKKRRASFFGALSRNSYSGQSPPKSRESVIAHHAGSRTDLLATPQPSPVKRSFFGGTSSSSEQKSTPKKLQRQSTTGTMDLPAKKKKENRFSTLGGFFGKSSPTTKTSVAAQQYPQATTEVMQGERQPIESPQPEQQQQRTPNKYQAPDKAQARAESQSRRNVLTKLSASVASPAEKEKEKERSRSRRPSAAGLLNGFMGRKSHQKERGSEDSRSQGSSQPQVWPQPLLSQTYSDLQEPAPPVQQQRQDSPYQRGQEQQPQTQNRNSQKEVPFHDPSLVVDEGRGRRSSREPQYDSVPIPGGYSLVRGQGAVAVPTEYDPRNLNRLQQQQQQMDPRYIQSQSQGQQPRQSQGSRTSFQSQHANIPQTQFPSQQQQPQTPQYADHPRQQQGLSHPQPQLGALEAYGDYKTSTRRISHEDILARSPPKPLIDQQRPYQLSLPGGEILDEDDDENTLKNMHANTPSRISNQNQNQAHSTSSRTNLNTTPTPNARLSRGSQDPIIRLQQPPTLRHPESPAGYPLPEDTVFSPVNPSAVNFPPPPPPKDGYPPHPQSQLQGHGQGQGGYVQQQRHSYDSEDLGVDDQGDLDRSNTRRTAVSAVSGISATRQRSGSSQHQHQSQNGGGTFGNLTIPSHQDPNQNQNSSRGLENRNPNLGINTAGRGKGLSPSPTPPSPMEGDDHGVTEGGIRKTVVNQPSVEDLDLYDASPRLPPGHRQSHQFEAATGNGHAGPTQTHMHYPNQGANQYQDGNGYTPEREGERQHRYPEEKIFYEGGGVGQENGPAELEDHETSMSATSYPGQEWNPYAMGAWDDGPDDVGVGVGAGVGPSFR